ncbi:MAG: hypothetical protein ABUS79_00695 [Pseudomonadota bacterium]
MKGRLLRLVAALVVSGCQGGAATPGASGGTGGGANGGSDGGGAATDAGGGAVTYYKHVLPIVMQHCAGCHNPAGFAPFSLVTYADADGYAALMAAATRSGEMPPWLPAAGCGDFRDARGLTAAEIATLQAWSDMGAPAGNPADAPAPGAPTGPMLGTPSVTLDPGAPYVPNPNVTDDYRCFLIDPALAAARDLVGFDVHPGAPASVHHVLLFSVAPAQIAAAQAKDNAEAGVGWTCFGGTGVTNTPTIGGWVPGSGASAFPPTTGINLPAGTRVIMQVHYNLLVQRNVSDRTTADLFYASAPITKPAAIRPLLNSQFSVPAGTASQTVTADLPVAGSYALWGVVPHMHLHGRKIKVSINHAGGGSTCAVDIPRWDFHWQQFYYYQQPIPVVPGDVVHLECTYDNSAQSQPVINGVRAAPAALTWGEKTTDEMCLSYLHFTAP